MILKDSLHLIKGNREFVRREGTKQSNGEYMLSELIQLRKVLLQLEHVSVLESDIQSIKTNTTIFDTSSDQMIISNLVFNKFTGAIHALQEKMDTIIEFWEDLVPAREDGIDIRLPDITDFSDLEKIAKDLKVAIELTLNMLKMDHNLKIITAEPGSIWLQVAFGAPAVVGFIGYLCSQAAKARTEFAKAKAFEEYSRTMKLNNDVLESFRNATKTANDLLLDNLAEEMLTGDREKAIEGAHNQVKLSIEIFSNLMDKGAKFIPQSTNTEVKNAFPNGKEIEYLTEAIKKIGNAE